MCMKQGLDAQLEKDITKMTPLTRKQHKLQRQMLYTDAPTLEIILFPNGGMKGAKMEEGTSYVSMMATLLVGFIFSPVNAHHWSLTFRRFYLATFQSRFCRMSPIMSPKYSSTYSR